ncbi:acetylcholine receptor subunit delta-like [Physella acuta]|uniref:acetylcholine receptor subunit delta-like n=1 Tax=Physella acuta TaxID=109671 RepID=UPI0027DC0B24|nr:acetylcholine receptor subunit delta-like [Physella acuta]XP_059158054.1 acetylcholine receptor subunit delta-like [Physella acuta]XP_059158055.1 acetylcholine receptor subunit delta-like [Physella acuta]
MTKQDMTSLFILVLFTCISVRPSCGQIDKSAGWDNIKFLEEALQTYNLIFHRYDAKIRPPRSFVEINAKYSLTHIRSFDLRRQELQMVLDIELSWTDGRLVWYQDRVDRIMSLTNSVWTPDIVYTNAVLPTRSMFHNHVMIYSSGKVVLTQKEEVTTFCATNLDAINQECQISIGFLSNSQGNQRDRFFSESASFNISDSFSNQEWDLQNVTVDRVVKNETGKISNINIYLTLEKKLDKMDTTSVEASESGSTACLGADDDTKPADRNRAGHVVSQTAAILMCLWLSMTYVGR